MKTAILQVADTGVRYAGIPGLPYHQAGTDGSIWTCSRFGPKSGERRGEWRRVKATPDKDGYPRVTLCSQGRLQKPTGVHIYVLQTFVGPRPAGMQACHEDGDTSNCRLDNLRWDTPNNNNMDKWKHGTQQAGEANGNSKLTLEQVKVIRKMVTVYGGVAKSARMFGVSRDTTLKIKQRKLWGWVE